MFASRYRRIVFFFGGVILSLFFWELVFPRIGLRGLARRTRSARLRQIAVRFRALAIRMGGVLIKVGQFLSSRLDVLPEEVTSELAGLQDEVPPEKFEDIRAVVETELGKPLAEAFAFFDPNVEAAASLGQVHRAQLHSGEQVVVKVQRPGIRRIIEVDLEILLHLAVLLERHIEGAELQRPRRRYPTKSSEQGVCTLRLDDLGTLLEFP